MLASKLGSELNPLALFLYDSAGSYGLAMAKATGSIVIVLLMASLYTRSQKLASVAQTMTLTVMLAVVINNLYVVLT